MYLANVIGNARRTCLATKAFDTKEEVRSTHFTPPEEIFMHVTYPTST